MNWREEFEGNIFGAGQEDRLLVNSVEMVLSHKSAQRPQKGPVSVCVRIAAIAMIVALSGGLLSAFAAEPDPVPAPVPALAKMAPKPVPGTVIDHSPASSGLYIGSPSIAVLTNGDYVTSHDFFGPRSGEHEEATTVVFRSADRGATWKKVSEIKGAFWSSLFVHRGALYLLGPNSHHGKILIRRSADGGQTWTSPADSRSGVIRDNGQYHCAPVPVLEHNGRLWRAFELRDPPGAWGSSYCAGMLSAPVEADLLDAANWTASNFVPNDPKWNDGDMGGWLEGNAVAKADGSMLDILRVETKAYPERAAMVSISTDGKVANFDAAKGFIHFPGGAKKFTIRHDAPSGMYWSVVNIVPERHQKESHPASMRNTLALTSSRDLADWTIRCLLLYHPDSVKHGFQYPDWLIDRDDLIVVVRTAFDDDEGGAHSFHDANYLTFHRWQNFRRLTLASNPGTG